MRFYALRLALLATAITAAPVNTSSVRADESKQSSESGSKTGNATTNSPSFIPKQNGLKQLEQDLFRPFENVAPKGSLDGAFIPAMPETQPNSPTVQSKRARELLEKRRDWVFETPEEILAAPSTDDILNRRDKDKQSDDKSKLSPMERFYERLYNKEKKESTGKGSKRDRLGESQKSDALSEDSETDDADLPLGVSDAQREMRKLLAPKERKNDSPAETGNAFYDVFGVGRKTQTREEVEIQKERMDRYKVLVGIPVTPSLESAPLKAFRDIVGTPPKSPGLFPTVDSLGSLRQQNSFGMQSGSAASTPYPSLLPEGAQIHTAPSLAPALPKIEPPRTLPPPVTFTAPRRAF